jgi:hypothetical protein
MASAMNYYRVCSTQATRNTKTSIHLQTYRTSSKAKKALAISIVDKPVSGSFDESNPQVTLNAFTLFRDTNNLGTVSAYI